MTVEQFKMARAALGWSIQILADKSMVSVRTIKRIESEGMIEKVTPANMRLLRETLEAAGIEFVGSAGEGPGVRLWKVSDQNQKYTRKHNILFCFVVFIYM